MTARYMVARVDGKGYRQVSRAEMVRMRAAGTIRFDGVDGDENANTVTYWYTREVTV
jgi:hypothetical protein